MVPMGTQITFNDGKNRARIAGDQLDIGADALFGPALSRPPFSQGLQLEPEAQRELLPRPPKAVADPPHVQF